jgi:hypothetical protein
MAEQNQSQYVPKLNPQVVLMGYLNSNAKDVGQLAGYLAGTNQKDK